MQSLDGNGKLQLMEYLSPSAGASWPDMRQHLLSSERLPFEMWQAASGMGYFTSLSPVAQRLTFVVCNSASSERIWSNFSYIHTKLRNRLSVQKSIALSIINAWYNMKDRLAVSNQKWIALKFNALNTVSDITQNVLNELVDEGNEEDSPFVPDLEKEAEEEIARFTAQLGTSNNNSDFSGNFVIDPLCPLSGLQSDSGDEASSSLSP
eukprot:ANDGO_05415.mRNA.1 hypothetical protein